MVGLESVLFKRVSAFKHVVGRISSFALLLGVVSLSQPAFAQTAEEKAGARSAANAGADAYDAGDYVKAIDLFQRAESVVHSPVHEMYIARAMIKVGRLVEARELLLKVGRENDGEIVDEAASELEALEPRVPRLTLDVKGQTGTTLEVKVDDRDFPEALLGVAQPFDPGEHTVTVTDGVRTSTQKFTTEEGKPQTVEVDLAQGETVAASPAETPGEKSPSESDGKSMEASTSGVNGMRVGSYVAMGLGVAGLSLGTVFSLQAGGHAKDANDLCDAIDSREGSSNCAGRTEAEETEVTGFEDKHKSAKTMGIIGFAAGGVLLATGVTLFFLSKPKETETVAPKRVTVDPVVGLGYLGLSGKF